MFLTPRRVSAHAAAAPKALALAAGTHSINYAELEIRSAQVTNLLVSLGVRADEPVGLLMRRSPDAVVAALGIMKAGAAYLPLDPSYPRDRQEFMLQDAGVRVVLADDVTPAPAGSWKTVCLAESHAQPTHAPEAAISPDSLAYIIYTSGSTGQPKGVMVSHGALANLVGWHLEAFGVTADDRASQVASFGFDAAVWEIWPYLAAGASVHFAGDSTRSEPERLRDWMLAQRISIGFAATPLAEHMIALDWPSDAPLRFLLTGADTLRRYPRRGLPFTLVNNYGPTECAVVSTSGVVMPSNSDELPPIGKPIRGVQAHIVDENLQAVPDGAAGELLIGGAGIARGYLNRPELTAEKFIRDPFSADPAARLYRTGDLARRLPDGQIAFVGRMDDQIKIRGFRIEPEEVAGALARHPHVRSAVVGARTGADGEKHLVAWLTGDALEPAVLGTFLSASLPDYMIPSAFVWLSELPLNASGKVDRAALPAPSERRVTPTDNGLEARLSTLVATLLKLKDVRRDDNFFLLGGHSLLGAQMIARIRDAFGVQLTLRNLFESPTVAKLAAAIERRTVAQAAGARK